MLFSSTASHHYSNPSGGCGYGSVLFPLFTGSEYIQGEGLRVLSGEKQLSLHEEIDVMLATLAGVQEETKEKKKKVRRR